MAGLRRRLRRQDQGQGLRRKAAPAPPSASPTSAGEADFSNPDNSSLLSVL